MTRRLRSVWLISVSCFTSPEVLSQSAPGPSNGVNHSSTELQELSISKMRQSIDQQNQSVERQRKSTWAGRFFLLPPAETTPIVSTSSGSLPLVAACSPLPASAVDSLVARASTAQNLDPELLRNVMRQESGFRPCSVSSKGALGLMQLMPATVEQFHVANPFDPASNVEAGAKLLKQLITKYSGDLSLALGAYNAGPASVDTAGRVPDFPETIDYVNRILSNLPAKKE